MVRKEAYFRQFRLQRTHRKGNKDTTMVLD